MLRWRTYFAFFCLFAPRAGAVVRLTAHLILTAAPYFGGGPQKSAGPFSRRSRFCGGGIFFVAREKQLGSTSQFLGSFLLPANILGELLVFSRHLPPFSSA